jgi:hypothetical protein
MVRRTFSPENIASKINMLNSNTLFKVFHHNIRGLKTKVEEFLTSLHPVNPHILCLTEHHLRQHEIEHIFMNQFRLGSKFCRYDLKNGGVCIFIHEEFEFSPISLNKYCVEKDIEVCAIKLQKPYGQIIVLAIYRAPSGNFNTFLRNLEAILSTWYSNGKQFLICGDININYLGNCKKRQQLDELLQTYNIIGTVTFPTHISNTSATAIDNIFITKTKNYDIYPYVTGLSDHDAQIIFLDNSVPKKDMNNNIMIRDINDHSILEFQLLMSHENWEETFNEEDVNISFNKFHNTYIRNFNSCFVKKQIKINIDSRPWITSGIRTSCNKKRELYQMMKNNISNNISKTELRMYYKRYCRLLTIVIKEAKRLHYKEIITKSRNKIKTTWKIISKETNKSTIDDTIKSLRINDQVSSNQSIIANELNEYFLNIVGSISNKHTVIKDMEINPLYFLFKHFNQPFKDMRWSYTTTKEINEIIKTLKDKNSSGYDEITSKIIKISKPFIIAPIINICNKMLTQGTFPERLKFSLIKPNYKGGNKSSPSNYRPISLLPVFSKIFEMVINQRLTTHLISQAILNEHQYGFRSGKSTQNASFTLVHEILTALNNKQMVGGLFCDLHKAFDCIDHNLLLKKLEFYGISGKFHHLITSYLDGRYQKVRLNKNTRTESKWGEIKNGVPQGSILGPILFLLYINDLPKLTSTDTKVLLYADDTSLIVTSPNLGNYEKKLNSLFEDLNHWFQANKLILNYKKTSYVQFNTTYNRDCKSVLTYQGNTVPNTKTTKFLGLIVDNCLSWKAHIDQMALKLNKACFAIRSCHAFMPPETLKMIYFAYFHSILSYGIIFWGNHSYSNKIFKIQKRVIRIITHSRRRDSCRELFKRLDILPLYSQYIFSISIFVIKNKHLFQTNEQIHRAQTRSKSKLHPPYAHLTQFQKGVYYSAIKIFNDLPYYIQEMTTDPLAFRNALKRFLLVNSFYNDEEYFNYKGYFI